MRAFGIAAFAPPLAAVNLNNNGTGQVLIFPYYTPFEQLFGKDDSCIPVYAPLFIFDREENTTTPTGCGFEGCTTPHYSLTCLETNVFGFTVSSTANSILGSPLGSPINPIGANGWVSWDTSKHAQQLQPASNGDIFLGLPITGFAATKFVNSIVSTPGGPVLANYTATYHHRSRTVCKNGNGACM